MAANTVGGPKDFSKLFRSSEELLTPEISEFTGIYNYHHQLALW